MSFKLGGDSGVSTEGREVLSKWKYDEETNRMSTEASVRSGLNSFELGEMHTTHSGGENVFDQNNISKINWFPVWQGVKPLPVSPVGKHIGFNPTARQYTVVKELETNGASPGAANVSYSDTITLFDNESIMQLRVYAGESYAGVITYELRDNDANGLLKYKQLKSVNVAEGDMIDFEFTHPSESRKGDVIYVNILKDDGADFLVKCGTNTSKPYLKLIYTNYNDVELVSATQYITDSFTVRYAGDYEVNTTDGGVTITVPDTFKETFYVSDAAQSFSPAKPCTVSFGGTQGDAVLQTSRDAYKFYYDSVGGKWRYKDLDTKSGAEV